MTEPYSHPSSHPALRCLVVDDEKVAVKGIMNHIQELLDSVVYRNLISR